MIGGSFILAALILHIGSKISPAARMFWKCVFFFFFLLPLTILLFKVGAFGMLWTSGVTITNAIFDLIVLLFKFIIS